MILTHVNTEGIESWLLVQMLLFHTLLELSSSGRDQGLLVQQGAIQHPGSQKVCQLPFTQTACLNSIFTMFLNNMCTICSICDKQNTCHLQQLIAPASAAMGVTALRERQHALHCAHRCSMRFCSTLQTACS